MTSIYLIDSDEESIVDFVNDQEELNNKTNNTFKDKARKDSLWERFASSHNLSVKMWKTLFESQGTHYGKLTQSKSGQAPKEMTEMQYWIQDQLTSWIHTSEWRASENLQAYSPHREKPVLTHPWHFTRVHGYWQFGDQHPLWHNTPAVYLLHCQ